MSFLEEKRNLQEAYIGHPSGVYICRMETKSTINRNTSSELFRKAKALFPGGVNSPVRAFKSVGGVPLFIKEGKGCRITDEDGNTFIDFCCSWGPLILGHAHPQVQEAIFETVRRGTSFGAPTRLENELAELIIDNNRFVEKIRFVSSGTEAVMSAVRLARGVTGKDKIIKFDGCYHGHVDALLVKAGSGLATFGVSTSAGIPEAFASQTIVLPLNDLDKVEDTLKKFADDIACIIIEPIPANNGLLLQGREYLLGLRKLCDEYGVLLIFDEVISGFRVGFEGAAGLYDIRPDIVTYGKIIGGGMPVGAYGASAEIMGKVAPDGPVYQAGTLSGNPVAMAAGKATLTELLKPNVYKELEKKTNELVRRVQGHAESRAYEVKVAHVGSIFWVSFSDKPILRADEIDPKRMENFKRFYAALLEEGVYFGPSGYEVGFVSTAHDKDALDHAAHAISSALDATFD